jgi:hypothetical protein
MKILLQTHENNLNQEERLIYQYSVMGEISVDKIDIDELFYDKDRLLSYELIVADVKFFEVVFKILEIPQINHNTYPECLNKFLKRNIWKGTYKDIFNIISKNRGVFAK